MLEQNGAGGRSNSGNLNLVGAYKKKTNLSSKSRKSNVKSKQMHKAIEAGLGWCHWVPRRLHNLETCNLRLEVYFEVYDLGKFNL